MGKIVIEVEAGKVIGVYGSEEMEVAVYEDVGSPSDEELDAMDEVVASVPFVLYRA